MKERSHLVIDASVVGAAGGEEARHPTSKHCRDFLKAVLRICNNVVLNSASLAEWKQHRSNFARKWYVSMLAHKKVQMANDPGDDVLQEKILLTASSEKNRAAMAKDFHLLDVALKTDRIIVSLDSTVLHLFALASNSVGEIKDIIWINPAESPDVVIAWLEDGTPQEDSRKLRSQVSTSS